MVKIIIETQKLIISDRISGAMTQMPRRALGNKVHGMLEMGATLSTLVPEIHIPAATGECRNSFSGNKGFPDTLPSICLTSKNLTRTPCYPEGSGFRA